MTTLALLYGCIAGSPGGAPAGGDGQVLECGGHAATARYPDGDGDGYGAGESVSACPTAEGFADTEDDCDDGDLSVFPGAEETCNGIDDDCDGEVDGPSAVGASTRYADIDGDTYGDPMVAETACTGPEGFVGDGGDCDDTTAEVNPGAAELCNGLDDDCDAFVDEADALDAATWYADLDGDGFGDPLATIIGCAQPAGYLADASDCDDDDDARHPGAGETCDGADDDCDGVIDEDDAADAPAWYADADSDGYGDAAVTTVACDAPFGFIADASDCDDGASSVSPGATEVCDIADVDEDCDGLADDDDPSVSAAGLSAFYADADGDGYGDATSATYRCYAPSGYVTDATDCDDTDDLANPGATEYCDDVDQDCDGDTYDAGTCSAIQNLEAIADGTWEGDTGTYGTIFWPTFVGDLDGDGTDDLVLTASKESDVVPGDDFGGIYYVPGGQAVHRGMTKTDLATAAWEGDPIHDALFYAWGAGDMDGDGNDDLWLGTDAYYGMASLLLGPASAWGAGGTAESVADVTWYGEDYRDCFPYANAATGEDLDGDGYDDAAFVRTNSGSPDYTQDAATFVIFGRADIAGDATRYPSDEVRIDGFDMSNVATGDLDGDGTDDLLLNGTDVIYLVDGSLLRSTTRADVTDLATASIVPDSSSGRGSSLQNYFDVVGDWTGDGIDDWAVADDDRPAGTREGTVYLLAGGTDALSAGEQVVDDVAEGSYVGDGPYPDRIGIYGVKAVEDMDGDGVAEISTSWATDWMGSQDAVALVFPSSDGISGVGSVVPDFALRLGGGEADEGAGWRVSSGDFDGDGRADLSAGSSQWNSQSGRSYLLLGGAIPWSEGSAW